jgi:lambda family phage portal protein
VAKRHSSRAKQRAVTPQNRYDAAGFTRQLRAYSPPNLGPNLALQGLQTIRNRGRDIDRNDWTGSSSRKWATTLIGIGITPRFQRIKDSDRRQVITDLWNDHSEVIDAAGVYNAFGLQTLAVLEWFAGGEVFARRRYRRLNDNLPVPMQVEVLGAEMVPLLTADQWPGMPVGNKMRDGIEFDRRLRKTAVWFHKEHPGDGNAIAVGQNDLVRVPIEDVIHMFEPTRAGQRRGVPMAAPVITSIKDLSDYKGNVMTRQKLANMFVAFLTRALPQGDFNATNNVDPLTGQPIQRDAAGAVVGLQPGIMQELDDGQDVKFSNPPEAGTTYSDYVRTEYLGVASSHGIPYELFSGDIREVSDRTLRVLINEFRRLAESRQWQMVIPMFCQRVINWFADAAVLSGQVSAAEYDDVRRVTHAPHGWAYIHPVQDPQGKKIEVDAGFRSRSSVIGERGDDPEAVDDERKADKDREDKLGLTPLPPAPTGADPTKPTKAPTKKPEPTAMEMSMATLLNAQASALSREQPAPAAPVINVTNHLPQTTVENTLPAPNVTVENNVSPTAVTVQNQVNPTPVTVENNLQAPNVNVVNEVQPSEVNVHLPARQTTSTVSYDHKGNIVGVTQLETDADDPANQEN